MAPHSAPPLTFRSLNQVKKTKKKQEKTSKSPFSPCLLKAGLCLGSDLNNNVNGGNGRMLMLIGLSILHLNDQKYYNT